MKNFLSISLISLMLFSCSKENSDVFVPYPTNPATDTTWTETLAANAPVLQIPALLATASKIDSVQVSTGGILRISDQLNVTFPANACTFANGTAVAGKIKVEVLHLKSKGDFIRFARPTTSFGRVLESGGAFFVRAFKENQELIVATGKSYVLSFISANPVNYMKVFYGQLNLTGTLPAGTNPAFTWVPSTDSTTVTLFQRTDSSGVIRGYDMSVKNFKWVNCDYFIDTTQPRTRVNITLPVNYTNTNTSVYAVFKDQKVVMHLIAESSSKSFTTVNIPVGKNVIFVSLSKIGDDLFMSTKDVTVTAGFHTNLVPEKRTLFQVNQFLDGL